MKKKYDVAAYVWPAYTGDEPRARIFWNEGYGEWQTVHNARYDTAEKPTGYVWDRRPLWGYVNEADPAVMEMQIDAAYRHGVNVFIYDWYWYDNRPFLENCLNDGYLKAKNCDLVKFYLMWSNHNATHVWSIDNSDKCRNEVIWQGTVTFDGFKTVVRRWIDKYFTHPSYYRIDGKPVLSIYSVTNLLKSFGGIDGTREAIAYLRSEVASAGLSGIHLQLIHNVFEMFDYDDKYGLTALDVYELLGFDSVTHYNVGTQKERNNDYSKIIKLHKQSYDEMDRRGIRYFPQVSVGWDANPRFHKYQPYIMTGNTPQQIKKALLQAREYVDTHDLPAPLVTVNSWNEWTETSYLQPDNLYGYGYLEAVKSVFAPDGD